MNMIDAWENCQHGGSIRRASNGLVVEKWIGEKPGHATSIDRWIAENALNIPARDMMAGDWEVVAT